MLDFSNYIVYKFGKQISSEICLRLCDRGQWFSEELHFAEPQAAILGHDPNLFVLAEAPKVAPKNCRISDGLMIGKNGENMEKHAFNHDGY